MLSFLLFWLLFFLRFSTNMGILVAGEIWLSSITELSKNVQLNGGNELSALNTPQIWRNISWKYLSFYLHTAVSITYFLWLETFSLFLKIPFPLGLLTSPTAPSHPPLSFCHIPSTYVSTVLTLLIPSRCIYTIWVLSNLMDLQHLWGEKSWIYVFSSNPPFNFRLENANAFLTFLLIYDCLVGISNLYIQSDSFNLHPTLIPNSPPSPVLPPQCIALSLIQLIVNSHTHTHIWRHIDSSSLTSL